MVTYLHKWERVNLFGLLKSTDLCASAGVLLNGSFWCTPYCSPRSHICGFSSFWNLVTLTSGGAVCCQYWTGTWNCNKNEHERTSLDCDHDGERAQRCEAQTTCRLWTVRSCTSCKFNWKCHFKIAVHSILDWFQRHYGCISQEMNFYTFIWQ